jgi:hypothetical protein
VDHGDDDDGDGPDLGDDGDGEASPVPRRRGGEDDGCFPLLQGFGAAGSDPSRRGQRLHRRRDLDKSRENRATPFSGEMKAWLKGEVKMGPEERTGRPHTSRFLGRVGHAHSTLVAPLFWFFLPRSFSQKNNDCAFFPGSFGTQKVLKHQNMEKGSFLAPRN